MTLLLNEIPKVRKQAQKLRSIAEEGTNRDSLIDIERVAFTSSGLWTFS